MRAFSVSYRLPRLHLLAYRHVRRCLSGGVRIIDNGSYDPEYLDVPFPERNKSVRKPFPTPMEVLIRRAKISKEIRRAEPCRMLTDAPENGLLVPELVPVAHRAYRAHGALIAGLKKLVQVVTVHRCMFCTEVHIGPVGHEIRTCDGPGSGTRCATHVWREGGLRSVVFFPQCFHLNDRVGNPVVGHAENHLVPRIPAIVELCSQAGVDLKNFPTKRRTKPVYSIEGRIVDFELMAENSLQHCALSTQPEVTSSECLTGDDPEQDISDIREVSIRTMGAWFEMVEGAKQMMEKYRVWTCGYCSEVQVGPKGHRLRLCKARKHQTRDGQHAWQEATIDDLIGPNYVWHVRDLAGPPLANELKRFYGKVPALVELCVQGGAPVPRQYASMMRLDVVVPQRDEADLV